MPGKSVLTWKIVLFVLLVASAFATGGCGARAGAGETAVIAPLTDQLGGAPLLADLPALVVTYDATGMPSLGETPLASLQALSSNTLLNQLTLDAATLDRLAAAGIQHIQFSNTPSGIRILVNGEALPTLVWDAESLDALLELLAPLEPAAVASLGGLLNTVTNLGAGLVIRLPVPPGAAPLPLIAFGAGSNAAAAEAAQVDFLDRTGVAPVLQIPVLYAADGTWTVQGLSDTQWQALTGLPFGYVRLNPELVDGAIAAGVNQVVIWTDAEGIHITLGERELPYLRWADGGIRTLLELLLRLGVVENAALDEATLDLLAEQWLPALQSTALRIVVTFPSE
jgi:hypothetical protein